MGQLTLLDDTPATEDGLGAQRFVETLFEALCCFQRTQATPRPEGASLSPPTVAIYGPWGSGKSSALNLLKTRFEQFNESEDRSVIDKPVFKVIRFSPWQHRHEPNQLIPLLLELQKQCDMTDTEQLKVIAALVLIPAAVVAVAAHAGDLATAAALAAPAAGKIITAAKPLAKAGVWQKAKGWLTWGRPLPELSEHAKLREKIGAFIREARSLRIAGASGQLRTLVILIDDLDRCHPPERVVELLEQIKVFLDCEGCLFVLACDRKAVTSAIESKFPSHGERYLEKFVTLGLTIPPPTSRHLLLTLLGPAPEDPTKADAAELERRYFIERVVKVLDLNPRRAKRFSNAWLTARWALDQLATEKRADPLLLAKWLLLREECPVVAAEPLRVLDLEQSLETLNLGDAAAVDALLKEFGIGRSMMEFLRGDAEQGRRFESALLLSRFQRLTGEEADVVRAEAERFAAEGKPIPGRDLSGIDFCFAQLRGADFSSPDPAPDKVRRFHRALFIGADLRDAKFCGADLTDVCFRRAKLEGVDFSGANVTRVDFGEADLGKSGVKLRDVMGFSDLIEPSTGKETLEQLRVLKSQEDALADLDESAA